MDLGRFHRAMHEIDDDNNEIGIERNLDRLVLDLNNLASNPANPEFSNSLKDHLNEFRESLLNSKSNDPFEEDVKQVISDLSLSAFLGEGLLNRVLAIFQANQLSANLASTALISLKTEVVKKLDLVASVNHAFTDLGVDYFSPEDNSGEMVINLPVEQATKTLDELSKETKEWHRICEAISETFDPDRTPITVFTLASGSWLFYLVGTPAFIYGVAKCMKGVNLILTELIKMKSLYSELVVTRTPKEILKKLEDHNSEKVKTDLEELAGNLVKEFYKGGDDARANELRNALSSALQRLSRKLADGTKVNLRLTAPARPQVADGEDPSPAQKILLKGIEDVEKIQKEIALAKPLLNITDHRAELQKSLPAPDVAMEPK